MKRTGRSLTNAGIKYYKTMNSFRWMHSDVFRPCLHNVSEAIPCTQRRYTEPDKESIRGIIFGSIHSPVRHGHKTSRWHQSKKVPAQDRGISYCVYDWRVQCQSDWTIYTGKGLLMIASWSWFFKQIRSMYHGRNRLWSNAQLTVNAQGGFAPAAVAPPCDKPKKGNAIPGKARELR